MRDAAHAAADAAGAEAAEQLKAARAETEVFRGQAKAAAIAQVKAEELARTTRAQAAKEAKAARLEAVELRQAVAHAKAGAEAAKAVAAQAVAEATALKEASKREAANTKRRMDRQTERASQSQGLMKPLSARAGAKEAAAPPTARAASAGRVGALSAEVAAEIEGRIGDAISAVLFRSRKAASAAEILSAVATIIQSPAPAVVGDTELGSAPPPPLPPPPQQQQPPPPPPR